MIDLKSLCSDLADEHEDLDRLVGPLAEDGLDLPTPAEGWSIRDQIAHLAFFDEQATLAADDPEAFVASLGAAAADPQGYVDAPHEKARAMSPGEVLAWWRAARADLLDTFETTFGTGARLRVPWYGPPMSPASFVSARLMETWAHGQDVADALGEARVPTPRLHHVAHLGVRARSFSYDARGLPAPEVPVAVVLRGPGGETWSWGEGAPDRVEGDALDFCLVVTQRRHVDDTDLVTVGTPARHWMEIAQAFAGPPGSGRRPGQFR